VRRSVLVERAQASGAMRSDVTVQDVTLLMLGVGRTIEITGSVAPKQWRRHLAIVLGGLRPDADGRLPGTSVTSSALEDAIETWARPLVGRHP
jgi:hypothetical protein